MKEMTEHRTLELCIVGAFRDCVIRECGQDIIRKCFPRCEVYDLHRLVVPCVCEQKHLRILGVLVAADLFDVEIAVRLDVD